MHFNPASVFSGFSKANFQQWLGGLLGPPSLLSLNLPFRFCALYTCYPSLFHFFFVLFNLNVAKLLIKKKTFKHLPKSAHLVFWGLFINCHTPNMGCGPNLSGVYLFLLLFLVKKCSNEGFFSFFCGKEYNS